MPRSNRRVRRARAKQTRSILDFFPREGTVGFEIRDIDELLPARRPKKGSECVACPEWAYPELKVFVLHLPSRTFIGAVCEGCGALADVDIGTRFFVKLGLRPMDTVH